MNQDEINQAEWNNRDNWSFLVYHSVRDSRTIVPKRYGFGWTINFRNKKRATLIMGLLLTTAITGLIFAIIVPLMLHKK